MKLIFDDYGNLLPYNISTISIKDFQYNFVFNSNRNNLFESYLEVVNELKTIGIEHFKNWINGSYTTLKISPKDIDAVFIIDFELFNKFEKELIELKKRYKSKLDLYYLIEYPTGHEHYVRTQFDKIEWHFMFSTNRIKQQKGYICINY